MIFAKRESTNSAFPLWDRSIGMAHVISAASLKMTRSYFSLGNMENVRQSFEMPVVVAFSVN